MPVPQSGLRSSTKDQLKESRLPLGCPARKILVDVAVAREVRQTVHFQNIEATKGSADRCPRLRKSEAT